MSFQVRHIKDDAKPRRSVQTVKRALPVVMALWRPLHGWYTSWKARQKHEERRSARVMLLQRTFAIMMSLLVATLLLGAIAQAVFSVQFSFKKLLTAAGTELPHDERGHFNVLLLGTGDDDHEGKDLIDTIIVASMDLTTKSVVMLSLPRDLYFLHTKEMGAGRINSLYRDYKGYLRGEGMEETAASKASLQMLRQEVGNAIGMSIHHVIKVNFTAFEKGVDMLGGIDITVPASIVDTQYPGPNYTYQTFSINAGPQHLDGPTALKYARSRHSTSDFDRSARQQQIIAAAIAKARKMELHKDIGAITDMYRILSEHVEMSLSMGELLSLAGIAEDFGTERMVTMQLNDQAGLYGGFVSKGGFLYAPPREQFEGASVLLPVSIPPSPITWKQLQTLPKFIVYHRELFLQPTPRVAVLNAGAPEGAARLLGGELLRYGFDVVEIGNNPAGKSDFSSVSTRPPLPDQDDTLKPHRAFLTKLLTLPEGAFPTGTVIEGAPDIVVTLGGNFRYVPFQDLVVP